MYEKTLFVHRMKFEIKKAAIRGQQPFLKNLLLLMTVS